MITTRSQRWRNQRMSMVGNDNRIDPSQFSVDVISCPRQAKPFIQQHHYSGTFPATRLSCGLFRNGAGGQSELVGVASFSVPMTNKVGPANTGYANPARSTELGRLVLLDDVEANGESWFTSRAFELLISEKPEIESVFSYSDPVRRTDTKGHIILRGHVGEVYQALNAICRGRSSPRTQLVMPNGRIASQRALSKIRNLETGADYAQRQLIDAGAPLRHTGEEPSAWLERIQKHGFFQRHRHPGNWAYVFGMNRKARKHLSTLSSVPYPKRDNNVRCGDITKLELMAA